MGSLYRLPLLRTDLQANVTPFEPEFWHIRSREAKLRGDTRMALIWCGTELLTEKGFQSTGIDEILSKVGVPKGSFYYYFKSKQDFGVAVIENYVRFYAEKMSSIFDDMSHTPLQRLQVFVEDCKDGMTKYAFKRGCLIGNMGQELAGLNEQFRLLLEEVLISWENRLEQLFIEAIRLHQLNVHCDPRALAKFFWIGWEGAILRAKLNRSVEPLDQFAHTFFTRILIP